MRSHIVSSTNRLSVANSTPEGSVTLDGCIFVYGDSLVSEILSTRFLQYRSYCAWIPNIEQAGLCEG